MSQIDKVDGCTECHYTSRLSSAVFRVRTDDAGGHVDDRGAPSEHHRNQRLLDVLVLDNGRYRREISKADAELQSSWADAGPQFGLG